MTPLLITAIVIAATVLGVATWKAPRLTSTLVWALMTATLTVSAIAMNVPGELSNNLIGLALLYPLLWVGLQFWCYWNKSKWRVAGGLIAVCGVLGTVISISTPLG